MTLLKNAFASETWQKLRDLTLPENRMIGGVCSGLGEATVLAAWMWRVIFLSTTLVWGVGFIAYVILMISIPNEK